MFVELNNLAGLEASQPPSGETILVTERDADGTFVLHHLLSLYLKGGHNACMVGLLQSLTHYNSVANKLALNLTKSREANSFVFVEALKNIGEQIADRCLSETPDDSGCDWIQHTKCKKGGSLLTLYHEIERALNGLSEWKTKSTVLILDDVSVLLSLGVPVLDIVYFVQYLRNLTLRSNACLAILCQNSASGDDEELEMLWQQLGYHSTILFEVHGLQTGYCKDIHGELSITQRPQSRALIQGQTKKVQFKISDKNVSFFALGMSAAAIGH